MTHLQARASVVLCLSCSVVIACVSCQKPTQTGIGTSNHDDYTEKYIIDISDPHITPANPSYELSKGADERITWINRSGSGMYVCANPTTNSPFAAYGWFVPPYVDNKTDRKSGKIHDGVNPPIGGVGYDFYSSSTFCTDPPSHLDQSRSTPRIIIKP
jgi:hypothetical protein